MDRINEYNQKALIFNDLFADKLETIGEKKTQLVYQQGENIFKQGAFAPYIMYVQSGLVKVFLQTGLNKQINIRLAKPGDFLAFSTVFGESVYTYSALAVKEATICMIDKEALKELLTRNPDFALQITSRNYRNESQLLEIIKTIAYKQMRGKLASALSYLSDDYYIKENIFNYLTRKDIAEFANITQESTVKFLKEFEKEGILRLDGKSVEIINKDKLESMARNG